MPVGTASGRLKKSIIFSFLKRLNENYCFQCGLEIETENELSVEHKIPYLDSENPVELFFSLDNIGFSHLSCNIGAARQTKILTHPSTQSYMRGCRCIDCTKLNTEKTRKYRHGRIDQRKESNHLK